MVSIIRSLFVREGTMKKVVLLSVFISIAIAGAGLSAAARGTPAEAKAMLQKALTHYASVGRTQALTDFTTKKAPFGDRDLYVVCIGPDHTVIANGGFPQFVGLSADLLRDAQGESVGKAGWDVATAKGQ